MKAKTRKSASKRFKRTKTKLLVQKSCKNHLLVNKSKRTKNVKTMDAPKEFAKQINRLLPNG
jgi:ribosomal protein L35